MSDFSSRSAKVSGEEEKAIPAQTVEKLKSKGVEDLRILSNIQTSEDSSFFPPGCYPASSAQKRQYLINQIEETSILYNVFIGLSLTGDINIERLTKACKELAIRHESLRTSFELIDGALVQKIHPEIDFTLGYYECETDQIDDFIKKFVRPFNLNQAPLFRAGLVKLPEENGQPRHLLIYDLDHIIIDDASINIITKELFALYSGQILPELKMQYKDFAIWQNAMLSNLDQHQPLGDVKENAGIRALSPDYFKKQEQYWLNTLAGELPTLDLPTDFPRPPLQSFEGDHIDFVIQGELLEKINKLAVKGRASLYMALMAAFNVLLMRYTGQNDILVGFLIAGRGHGDFNNIIGMFVNTLVLRTYPEGNQTFLEFLREVRENMLHAYENRDYQFEVLVEKLNVSRDLSRNPLFDVLFDFQDMNPLETKVPGLQITPYKSSFYPFSKFDLSLDGYKTQNFIQLNLEYSVNLFKKETMERFKGHYLNVLDQITANPSICLSEINILTPEEKHQILIDFNKTAGQYLRILQERSVSETISIGSPLSTYRVYILDHYLNLVPPLVKGEIFIAGEGLAGDYLVQPGLTQEKLVPDPFEPNGKMYRTGDLARWLPDGNIEFLGRVDYQVKTRDYMATAKEELEQLQELEALLNEIEETPHN